MLAANRHFGRKANVLGQSLIAEFFNCVTAVAKLLSQTAMQQQDDVCGNAGVSRREWRDISVWRHADRTSQCEHQLVRVTPWSPDVVGHTITVNH